MVVGIDYYLSYVPVINVDVLLLMVVVAISKKIILYFLDISNSFQINSIHDKEKGTTCTSTYVVSFFLFQRLFSYVVNGGMWVHKISPQIIILTGKICVFHQAGKSKNKQL